MEILNIGTYKGYQRKALNSFRPADEGIVDNKRREDGGRRGALVRSTIDGDTVALSLNDPVSSGKRKAVEAIQSSLAKENSGTSFVSRGVGTKGISDLEKMVFFPLNTDTQFVTDQSMIGKVTPDMTGYAINKYREAWTYRHWAVTTFEAYA